MKKRIRLAAAAALLLLLTGCGKEEYKTDFFAMDTLMSFSAYGDGAQERTSEAERAVNALENELSRTREQSGIYALNHAEGQPVEVPEETYQLLAFAYEMAEKTDGAFDPTVAALSDLWQIGTEQAHVPEAQALAQAVATVDYHNLVLSPADAQSRTAQLLNGAQIDLGGVGKGWAADTAAAGWKDAPADTGALLMLGGNIYAVGQNDGGKPWTVGVGDPDNTMEPIALLSVTDESVVTSGDYQRYFEENGVRYHHIFDPKTGYPVKTDLRSVTIVDENSAKCDALSTALFVMGEEKAMAYAEENGIKAVLITADKRIRVSGALHDQFEFNGEDAGYVFAP